MSNRGKWIEGYAQGGLVPYPAEFARRRARAESRGVQVVLGVVAWVSWAVVVAVVTLAGGQP